MADVTLEKQMANAVRALAMDAVEKARSGHPGMPMGMADAATVLFSRFMLIDPSNPRWPNRDRFVLSAGHGSMLQYAIHHLVGYVDMDLDQIKSFRQLGARTAGHPEYGHADGVETTTGPLGQGLANAVGMALGERMMNARFGDGLVDHFTYVIAGDGCLMEGISHEAIDMAGHLALGRLIVLWDDNEISIDGATSLATSTDQAARFEASGWHVVRGVDGHDNDAVAAAIEAARADGRPSLLCCRTTIGFGAPTKAGTAASHGSPLGADEIKGAREALGWHHPPFHVPSEVRAAWANVAARGQVARGAWEARRDGDARGAMMSRFLEGISDERLAEVISAHKQAVTDQGGSVASRKASEMALSVINEAFPQTIGGSADLTGSNNTKTKDLGVVTKSDFSGRYLHYGVREHAMAAVMNGLVLYGGFKPYGGTFLVFTDYARPAIRLSALMGLPVVYVMTHDSIGLGEDGPTHQPVEHLAAMRAIPGLLVLRPCDAVETAEAWQIALSQPHRPSVLALSRQNLPLLRRHHDDHNHSARGAYILGAVTDHRDITLIATGSEVSLAVEAQKQLLEANIRAVVVSAPSLELFAEQPLDYRRSVLGDAPRVIIEAGVRQSWCGILRDSDQFVGMKSFGISAPFEDAYRHFGITGDAILDCVAEALQAV
jgi:transketolase